MPTSRCLSAAIAAELVKTGKLKGFGILGRNRFPGLPNIETPVEAGYQNLDLQFWHALFAPARHAAAGDRPAQCGAASSFANAKVQEAFVKNGMELYPASEQTPEAATAMLKSEIKRWGDVIRANNIEVELRRTPYAGFGRQRRELRVLARQLLLQAADVLEQPLAGEPQEKEAELRVLEIELLDHLVAGGEHLAVLDAFDGLGAQCCRARSGRARRTPGRAESRCPDSTSR